MNYAALIKAIQSATGQLQGRVATVANQALVLRNWMVGVYLVEFEQCLSNLRSPTFLRHFRPKRSSAFREASSSNSSPSRIRGNDPYHSCLFV